VEPDYAIPPVASKGRALVASKGRALVALNRSHIALRD
jgi:hypothetical protein